MCQEHAREKREGVITLGHAVPIVQQHIRINSLRVLTTERAGSVRRVERAAHINAKSSQ